jgi:D-aminopeptidase
MARRIGSTMLVAVSADMEGISQLVDPREILACCQEYWQTGKPRLEADVAAVCLGLLDAGASEIVVLDNHGSGNPRNIAAESLPSRARLEGWDLFDLAEHGVDALFQVGYHARGGVEGFISHTYVPGLRLRVDDELISESHGRAWAADLPLLGIVGNDEHRRTLGSLEGTPFLVVQESRGRGAVTPTFADATVGLEAIRSFAAGTLDAAGVASEIEPPAGVNLAASMPNGADVLELMTSAGWQRTGDVEFGVELESWREARDPIRAAMGAAISPFMPYWFGDLTTSALAERADPETAATLASSIESWARESQPEWWERPSPAISL